MPVIEFGFVEILGGASLGLIGCFLYIFLSKSETETSRVIIFLFCWISCVQIVGIWFLDLIPLPNDSFIYYGQAKSLAEANYSNFTVRNYLRPEFINIPTNSYKILLSVLYFVGLGEYGVLHLFHISIFSVACGVLYRLNYDIFKSRKVGVFLVICLMGYFEIYWATAHLLREPFLVVFLALAMDRWFKWYVWERPLFWNMFGFVLASMALRPELLVPYWMMLIVLSYLWSSEIQPLNMLAGVVGAPVVGTTIFWFGSLFLGSAPIATLNRLREKRAETGYAPTYELLNSYGDVFLQIPEGMLFTLVPIWPWEVSTGATYVRAYAHSLTVLIILLLGTYGGLVLFRRLDVRKRLARGLVAVIASCATVVAIVGLIDVTVGPNARHSAPVFLIMITFFSSYGAEQMFST